MEADVERWVWVSDFRRALICPRGLPNDPKEPLLLTSVTVCRGFSSRDCDPAIARIFLQLASQHYPGRLRNVPFRKTLK